MIHDKMQQKLKESKNMRILFLIPVICQQRCKGQNAQQSLLCLLIPTSSSCGAHNFHKQGSGYQVMVV
jgi:hypothetical protein